MGRTRIYELDLAESVPGQASKKRRCGCRRGCCSCCRCGISARCVATVGCLIMAALLVGTLLVHFGVVAVWINSPSTVDARNEAATREECMQILEQRAQAGTLTSANNMCQVTGTNLVVLRRTDGVFHTGVRVMLGTNSGRRSPPPVGIASSSSPQPNDLDEALQDEAATEEECMQLLEQRAQAGTLTRANNDCEVSGTNSVVLRRTDGVFHTGIRVMLEPDRNSEVETTSRPQPNDLDEAQQDEAATEEECRQMLDQRAQADTLTPANNECEISGTSSVVLRLPNGAFIRGAIVHDGSADDNASTMTPNVTSATLDNSRHRRSINGGEWETASSAPEADTDDKPDGTSVTVIAHDSDLDTLRGVRVHLEQPNSESETSASQDKSRHRRSAIGEERESAQSASSTPEADADDETDGTSVTVTIRDNDGAIHRGIRVQLPLYDDASETTALDNPRQRRSAIGGEWESAQAASDGTDTGVGEKPNANSANVLVRDNDNAAWDALDCTGMSEIQSGCEEVPIAHPGSKSGSEPNVDEVLVSK